MLLRLRPLAVTACLLAAVACDSPVDVSGSIFLKNGNGGVTTFPLVQVNVYTEGELQALATARKARAVELRNGLVAADTLADSLAARTRMAWTLLDSLPTAAISVKSDAEGKFPLTLEPGQRYLAMARASTTVNAPVSPSCANGTSGSRRARRMLAFCWRTTTWHSRRRGVRRWPNSVGW